MCGLSLDEITTQKELELNFYYAPMVLENEMFVRISEMLFNEYFNLKKTKTLKEYSIFKKIEQFIMVNNASINPDIVLSQTVALWILHAFYDHEILSDESPTYDVYLWKNRHTIINNLLGWLKKLLLFLDFKQDVKLGEVGSVKNSFFTILLILTSKHLLMSKKVWTDGKSQVYLCCGLYLKKYNFFYKYKIFLEKPELVIKDKIFFIGVHYSSLHLAIHTNWKSKTSISMENAEFLEKLGGLQYFIDWSMHTKIKNLLNNTWFGNHVTNLEDLFYQLCLTKKKFWKKSNQRYFSRLYMYLVFWTLETFKKLLSKGFYLSYFIDFRGRVYSNSIISPIGNRIFRYLYTYGTYSKEEWLKFNWDDAEKKQLVLHHWFADKLHMKYVNVDLNCDAALFCIYNVYFEIGKIFKSQYLNEHEGKISWKTFLKKGSEYINSHLKISDDFEKSLDFLYIYNILNKINNDIFDKVIIYKDATASAIQLLMLVLGTNDHNRLAQCNLVDGNYWYDTYYYIINDFIVQNNIEKSFAEKYLTRSLLKKTIMTYNYEATFWTCWNEYSEQLTSFDEEVLNVFKNFYKYLSNLFEVGAYYKLPSKTIIEVYKNFFMGGQNLEYITTDGIRVNLDYYKTKPSRFEKKIQGVRSTISWVELSDELDEVKIFRALRANLIHTLDGCIARAVILKMPKPIITIHDSYGADILNIELLIKIVNSEYNLLKDKNNIIPQNIFQFFNVESSFIIL